VIISAANDERTFQVWCNKGPTSGKGIGYIDDHSEATRAQFRLQKHEDFIDILTLQSVLNGKYLELDHIERQLQFSKDWAHYNTRLFVLDPDQSEEETKAIFDAHLKKADEFHAKALEEHWGACDKLEVVKNDWNILYKTKINDKTCFIKVFANDKP
jgi:hypothetical protein